MQEREEEQLRTENDRLARDLRASSSHIEELTSEVEMLHSTDAARMNEYTALGKGRWTCNPIAIFWTFMKVDSDSLSIHASTQLN